MQDITLTASIPNSSHSGRDPWDVLPEGLFATSKASKIFKGNLKGLKLSFPILDTFESFTWAEKTINHIVHGYSMFTLGPNIAHLAHETYTLQELPSLFEEGTLGKLTAFSLHFFSHILFFGNRIIKDCKNGGVELLSEEMYESIFFPIVCAKLYVYAERIYDKGSNLIYPAEDMGDFETGQLLGLLKNSSAFAFQSLTLYHLITGVSYPLVSAILFISKHSLALGEFFHRETIERMPEDLACTFEIDLKV